MKYTLVPLAFILCLASASLRADDPDGQYETGRAVARISVLNGDVSVRRGDSGDVTAAALNAPLMADDRLLTGSSARAEVQLDSANMLRIGPNSEVRFSGMDVKNFQIQVGAGTVTFRVLRPSQAQTEIDTASVAVRPLNQGVYRVTVREDGSSEITVRSGELEIYSSSGSERLVAGQTMNARGSAADAEFQIVQAIPYDNWDRWNEDRDHYLERSQAYRHVSPDVSGAEDLDQYGDWVDDPSYGTVWAPRVATGWAPYRDGRWVWEDWYGWTWVSYDPWGWAPYHYGRWFNGSRGWCWYPGGVYSRHYWSPALVAFFGFGHGGGVGFGFGNVGWVPLAPFETFHPWWGRGYYNGFRNGGFGNRTTIVNNVNIFNSYRNARFNGGMTGVNAGEFGRRGQFMSLNRDHIQNAGLVRGAVPVSPDRASLRFSDRTPSGNFPVSRAQSFASRGQSPRIDRVPFDQQQRGMTGSRPGFSDANRGGAGNSGGFARPMNDPQAGGNGWRRMGDRPGSFNQGPAVSNPSGGAPQSHGWGRFGEPIHGNNGAQSAPQAPVDRGRGWQRFDNTRPQSSAPQNFSQGQRSFGGGGEAVRINPPIVRDRAPNAAQAPNYQGPRNYESPRNYQQRTYEPQRSVEQPRQYEAPRNFERPRNFEPPQRNYEQPRNYQQPRSFEAPRNFGGGGGGGGGREVRSAPNVDRGGGGGAQRNSGGGGGNGGGGDRGGGHGGHGGRR